MTVENTNPVQVASGKVQKIKNIFKLILSFIIILTIVFIIAFCFVNREKQILEAERRNFEAQKTAFDAEKTAFENEKEISTKKRKAIEKEREAIKEVINQTIKSKEPLKKKNIEEIKKSLVPIIEKIRNINLDKCPSDFAKAYKEYIIAWENINKTIQKIPNKSKRPSDLDELNKEIKHLSETWEELKSLARQYNVYI